MFHRFPAADANLPAWAALNAARVLDVLSKYACAPCLASDKAPTDIFAPEATENP